MQKKNYAVDLINNRIDSVLNSKIDFLDFIGYIFRSIKGSHLVSHTFEVAYASVAFGQYLGLSPLAISLLFFACVCHDLGKVQEPDEIIQSPESMTEMQFNIMKMHPEISVKIASTIPIFNQKFNIDGEWISVLDIILYHHERVNGKGYYGKKGNEIPTLAKIVAITDAFVAMIDKSRRFNRNRSIDPVDVVERMRKDSGKQFDAELFEKFAQFFHESNFVLKPDLKDVNTLFAEQGGLPLVNTDDLFKFMEVFIDKEREIAIRMDGHKYTILEIEEPYIIDQRPDFAVLQFYENDQELAVLTQKKELLSLVELEKCMHLTEEDLKKASPFMEVKNKKFFFTNLNNTPEGCRQTLNRFGSFTVNELRVFLEDLTGQDDVKELLQQMIEHYKSDEIIYEIEKDVYSIKDLNLFKLLDKPFLQNNLKEILIFLKEKFVKDAPKKREKIFEKWLEIKQKTIKVQDSKINQEFLDKLQPYVDYIWKINFRGVPLRKIQFMVDDFINKFIQDNNEFIETKRKVYRSIILFYFIEVFTVSDKHFSNINGKDVDYSQMKIKEAIDDMKKNFSELDEYLEIARYKFINLKDNDIKPSSIVILFSLIEKYIGTNALLKKVHDHHPDTKEKKIFLSWLFDNINFVHPSERELLKNIINT